LGSKSERKQRIRNENKEPFQIPANCQNAVRAAKTIRLRLLKVMGDTKGAAPEVGGGGGDDDEGGEVELMGADVRAELMAFITVF
jgi:hypothetical protein